MRGMADTLQQLQMNVAASFQRAAASYYTLYIVELTFAYSTLNWTRQQSSRFYNTPLQWLIPAHLLLVLDKVPVDILTMLKQYISQHIKTLQLENKNKPQRRRFPLPKYFSGRYWRHGQAKNLLAMRMFKLMLYTQNNLVYILITRLTWAQRIRELFQTHGRTPQHDQTDKHTQWGGGTNNVSPHSHPDPSSHYTTFSGEGT